jgi:hypothetical protein
MFFLLDLLLFPGEFEKDASSFLQGLLVVLLLHFLFKINQTSQFIQNQNGKLKTILPFPSISSFSSKKIG